MPNKVIIRNKKEEVKSKSEVELRRLNAKLQHEDIPEDELAHFGVMGMKWGVRKGSSDSGGNSIRSKNILQKAKDALDKPDKDFAEATKGMNKAKAVGIYMALGPYWGAKAINAAKAKAANPKEIVKKETKILRKKIEKDFDAKVDSEFKAHEAEFKAKYGKTKLSHLKNTPENNARADAYSSMLTKRMEKILTDSATTHLAGTKYGIREVKGFNDFLPDYEIYIKD